MRVEHAVTVLFRHQTQQSTHVSTVCGRSEKSLFDHSKRQANQTAAHE